MQRHQSGLAELALPNRQHLGPQVHVGIVKPQRLGDAQSRAGDQAEQRLDHCRSQGVQHATRVPKASGSGQQFDDLVLVVNVWRRAARNWAEDGLIWYFCCRLELAQPTGERSQQPQLARRSGPVAVPALGLACPGGHQIDRQRPLVANLGDVPGEAHQTVTHGVELEAGIPALDQVLLDPGLQGNVRVHGALPGHGSATPANAPWSSLA